MLGEAAERMVPAGNAGDGGVLIHPDVLDAFQLLRSDAEKEGFDLRIRSGFRSFDGQLAIWNRKVRGELAVLDDHSKKIPVDTVHKRDLLCYILRWSALPGASRHHWGTEIDYYAYNGFTVGGHIELVPDEYRDGGPCADADRWLNAFIAEKMAHSFFKPYGRDRGGVHPEPWHLSWAPLADHCQNALKADLLLAKLQASPILLKEFIVDAYPEIWSRFVVNVESSG